jgi:dTDP-4-dehydrorhamnose 3,5-epimerase
MKIRATPIPGAFVVEAEPHTDERGFFARTFCRDTFVAAGLDVCNVQSSMSWNDKRGTLRGMHWQRAPHEEAKLVSCARGAIHDVLLDLREGSPTWGRWAAFELSAKRPESLYVPRGVAHGFQTLEDDTLVLYQMSTPYVAECSVGVRFDDPAFAIRWPIASPIVSTRDREHALVERRLPCAS